MTPASVNDGKLYTIAVNGDAVGSDECPFGAGREIPSECELAWP